MKKRIRMWLLKRKVIGKTRKWREVLRLQRWLINGQLVEGADCEITYNVDQFSATMNIGVDVPKWELDFAICHELLHLFWAEKLTEEQNTELLARAIVRQYDKHLPLWAELLICVCVCNAVCLSIHFLLFW